MKATRHLPLAPMRPKDVLACIRDSYRFAEKLDPDSEPGIDLTFESTIDEWRSACDLLGASELGVALNAWFGVAVDDTEWAAVLEPASQRRLRGVCELVSHHAAHRPALRPFPIAGHECLEAGAFLTLRAALIEAGLPAAEVRPSTALTMVARHDLGSLVRVVGKLAPGILPVPPLQTTWGMKIVLASFIIWLLAPLLGNGWYAGVAALTWLAGMVVVSCNHESQAPIGNFAEVRTFGDLARRIADHHREAAI